MSNCQIDVCGHFYNKIVVLDINFQFLIFNFQTNLNDSML